MIVVTCIPDVSLFKRKDEGRRRRTSVRLGLPSSNSVRKSEKRGKRTSEWEAEDIKHDSSKAEKLKSEIGKREGKKQQGESSMASHEVKCQKK